MFITVKRPDSDETLEVSKKLYESQLKMRGFRDVAEIKSVKEKAKNGLVSNGRDKK